MEQLPVKKVANLARIKTDSTYTDPARKMYNEALVGKKGEIFSVCEAFCAFILKWYRTYYTYDRLCVCGRIVWASGTKKTSMIQWLPEL